MKAIHPAGSLRQRNFAKAYERDPQSAGDQPGNELAGIGPIPVERVGRDQNMHGPESSLILFWMRYFAKIIRNPATACHICARVCTAACGGLGGTEPIASDTISPC